ncbi:MAG: type IV secretory system conjugative DNA transfer family protein [Clostridia bacterium]|nr:type IV secretory system conjugative DNA transfer family protein [Clostridia bacterium]
MKKPVKFLLCLILFAIIGYAAGAAIYFFTQDNVELVSALTTDYAYYGAAGGAVIGIVFFMMTKPKKVVKDEKSKGKTASGNEMELSYDAQYLPVDKIKDQFGLISTTWAQLPSLKNTGIVFRNTIENNKYNIAMKDEYHCLIIGTTASGKSSLVLLPSIRIYAHSGEKPCMVISDPKGELFEKTSRVLEDEGYRVITLNLRDPFSSTRWNPMDHAFELYHKGKNCKKNIKKCSNGTKPKDAGYREIPGETYGQEWFGFEGIAYPNEDSLRVAVNSAEQVYCDLAQNELREICNTIAPKSSAQDPTWEEGAQDYLYGCALAMLEDSLNPELGMTKEKFNFYNLYKIATYRDPDAEAPFETVRKYLLQGRDAATSNVPNMTSAVINNSPNTTKSYLGVLNGKISFMQDIGISYLTSESDISFDDFTSKPTAFYLIIPDDREERHNLAILCLSQLYKRLVDKANTCPGQKLPTHVYFILEEFGNLPPIPKFESMITVSRGRNILYEMAVQSYTQLETKYGADKAKTIIGNCNAQIYIGTDDQPTRDSFSKMCGEVQLLHEEKNTSVSKSDKDKDGKQTSTSTSTQRTTRSLITPYELGQLKFGEVIVKMFRYNPIRTNLTRVDQVPFFYKKNAEPQIGIMKSLDTQKVYYDIKMRNKKVLKQSSPFDF